MTPLLSVGLVLASVALGVAVVTYLNVRKLKWIGSQAWAKQAAARLAVEQANLELAKAELAKAIQDLKMANHT